VGSVGDRLRYLSHIGSDNLEEMVCQFGERETPTGQAIPSGNDASNVRVQYFVRSDAENVVAAAKARSENPFLYTLERPGLKALQSLLKDGAYKDLAVSLEGQSASRDGLASSDQAASR
jgi:hypothetical protein